MIGRPRVERRAEGVRLRLPARERRLLRQLVSELDARLDGDTAGDDLHRLFPPAYPDDPGEESEYRRLMQDELLGDRRRALGTVAASLDADHLSEDELDAWLGALNDLRLVLGTRLDVDEETFARRFDPRDPSARERAVYLYLSWLQEQAVAAAAARPAREQ